MNEAKELLIALRGEPDHCNFCGRGKPLEELQPSYLHCVPLDEGDWICSECIARLGYGGDANKDPEA